MITPTPCPICDGDGLSLGILGTLEHFQCQQCGMFFHQRLTDDEIDILLYSYEDAED